MAHRVRDWYYRIRGRGIDKPSLGLRLD